MQERDMEFRELYAFVTSIRQKLARRCDENVFQFFNRALCGGVKKTDGFDFITKKIKTDRMAFCGGPNIEQTSTMRELARLEDSVHTLVADPRPFTDQTIRFNVLVYRKLFTRFEKVTARQCARHQRTGGRNNDRRVFGLFYERQIVGR